MTDKLMDMAIPANAPKPNLPANDSDPLYGMISEHKFAVFSECDKDGNLIAESPVIRVMLTDGEKTIESNYQTPFENSNPEHKLPTLMAALQTGELVEAMANIVGSDSLLGKSIKVASDIADPVTGALKNFAKSAEGKTNLTKINTTQVFVSTASIRISLSLVLIALRDARVEVEEKIAQLEAWALPQYLSDRGLVNNVNDVIAQKGVAYASEGIFSGVVPPFICINLHGKAYAPFVIESVSSPIDAPIDENGNRLSLAFSINLLSRAAWDASDIKKLYGMV